MSNPIVSGTYQCSTQDLRAIEARMEAGEDITWGDVLTPEQETCLMFVMKEVITASEPKGLDPAMVFATMIDVDGTFVAVVDSESLMVELDFRLDEKDQS